MSSLPNTRPGCNSCRFFLLATTECRIKPPTVIVLDGLKANVWPEVGPNDWCGAHTPWPERPEKNSDARALTLRETMLAADKSAIDDACVRILNVLEVRGAYSHKTALGRYELQSLFAQEAGGDTTHFMIALEHLETRREVGIVFGQGLNRRYWKKGGRPVTAAQNCTTEALLLTALDQLDAFSATSGATDTEVRTAYQSFLPNDAGARNDAAIDKALRHLRDTGQIGIMPKLATGTEDFYWRIKTWQARAPVKAEKKSNADAVVVHGVTCVKRQHVKPLGEYLHDEADDTPYTVDGVTYCGRCHHCLPS